MDHNKDFTYLVSCRPLQNNYKYYQAIKTSDNTFDCKYGRIGDSGQPTSKSLSQWRTKYNANTKPKKGYIDRSDYFQLVGYKKQQDTSSNGNGYFISDIPEIASLVTYLLNASNKSIKENYVLSDVLPTDKLFTRVQELIDSIRTELKVDVNIDIINDLYLELISLSQRRIGNVKYALFSEIDDDDKLTKAFEKLDKEQDLLNTLESSVKTTKSTIDQQIKDLKKDDSTDSKLNLFESMGIMIEECTTTEVDRIKHIVKTESTVTNRKVKSAFKLTNNDQQVVFDKTLNDAKNKKTRLLWHGSRSENYLSIIEKSLKIRPAGVTHTGSMFSDGVYFASDWEKSAGYASGGRWNNAQSASKLILLLFDVHVGNEFIVRKHDSSCYTLDTKIKNSDYDSTWAKKGQSLYRDEIIVYNSDQCTPRYIVEFE